jgi:hypothetical protein
MDWAEACRILGVPESATDTEIKEQYFYKAQLLHPDKNIDKPEYIRKKAEAELAQVNQAYSFLTNSSNNPYKVPPKLLVLPKAIRFRDLYIGQRKNTTITVSNTGGPYTSIWLDNKPAPWLTVTGIKSITSERLPIEVELECEGVGEPGSQHACDLLIKLENSVTQVVDQAAIRIELYIRKETAVDETQKEEVTAADPVLSEPAQDLTANFPSQRDSLGFSIRAFLINLFAFMILGAVLFLGARYFFPVIDTAYFIIASIIYGTIACGICINHGINVGSRAKKLK